MKLVESGYTVTVGANRGTSRIWLEGKKLAEYGWNKGTHFNTLITEGGLTYSKSDDNFKNRIVAGTETRPIIDTNSKKLNEFCNTGDSVQVVITNNHITITLK